MTTIDDPKPADETSISNTTEKAALDDKAGLDDKANVLPLLNATSVSESKWRGVATDRLDRASSARSIMAIAAAVLVGLMAGGGLAAVNGSSDVADSTVAAGDSAQDDSAQDNDAQDDSAQADSAQDDGADQVDSATVVQPASDGDASQSFPQRAASVSIKVGADSMAFKSVTYIPAVVDVSIVNSSGEEVASTSVETDERGFFTWSTRGLAVGEYNLVLKPEAADGSADRFLVSKDPFTIDGQAVANEEFDDYTVNVNERGEVYPPSPPVVTIQTGNGTVSVMAATNGEANVAITIIDSAGTQVASGNVATDVWGSFRWSTSGLASGTYTMVLTPTAKDGSTGRHLTGRHTFTIGGAAPATASTGSTDTDTPTTSPATSTTSNRQTTTVPADDSTKSDDSKTEDSVTKPGDKNEYGYPQKAGAVSIKTGTDSVSIKSTTYIPAVVAIAIVNSSGSQISSATVSTNSAGFFNWSANGLAPGNYSFTLDPKAADGTPGRFFASTEPFTIDGQEVANEEFDDYTVNVNEDGEVYPPSPPAGVYINPGNGTVSVDAATNGEANVAITIIDSAGTQVASGNVATDVWGKFRWSTSGLASGTYTMVLTPTAKDGSTGRHLTGRHTFTIEG